VLEFRTLAFEMCKEGRFIDHGEIIAPYGCSINRIEGEKSRRLGEGGTQTPAAIMIIYFI
jgi:hypothetical protein